MKVCFNHQLIEESIVGRVAALYNRSPAQVLLRWALEHGVGECNSSALLKLVLKMCLRLVFYLMSCPVTKTGEAAAQLNANFQQIAAWSCKNSILANNN